MADGTNIQWTDATWPVILGCTKQDSSCLNCYAVNDAWRLSHHPNPKVAEPYRNLVHRLPNGKLNWTGKVHLATNRLTWPGRWKQPRKIFVCNEGDLFHPEVPDAWIDLVMRVMAQHPRHTFQLLTKQPERAYRYLAGVGLWPLANVWLGFSAGTQKDFDERWWWLRRTPAAIRWASLEPLLEPIDPWANLLDGPTARMDWVVVGGESGHGARATDIENIRFIVRKFRQELGAAVFVKQLGGQVVQSWNDGPSHLLAGDGPPRSGVLPLKFVHKKGGDPAEWPADLRLQEFPATSTDVGGNQRVHKAERLRNADRVPGQGEGQAGER